MADELIGSTEFLHQAVQRVSARPFGVGAGGRDKKTVSRGHKKNGLPACAGLRQDVQAKRSSNFELQLHNDDPAVVLNRPQGLFNNK